MTHLRDHPNRRSGRFRGVALCLRTGDLFSDAYDRTGVECRIRYGGHAVLRHVAVESFYEALVGRPADSRPMPVLKQWEWGEVVLQIVDDADRAGGGLATVVVADMAEATAGLRERGIAVEATEGSVVAQVAVLTDPDGNQVTLIEAR